MRTKDDQMQRVFRTLVAALLLLSGAARLQAQQFGTPISLTAQDSGACTTANACATIQIPAGSASVGAQLTGTFSGTVTFEVTADGVNWVAVSATNSSNSSATTATTTGIYTIANTGYQGFRVRCSTYASGTIGVVPARGAASSGGGGSSVTINDPTTPTQKVAVNGSGQMSITCANCSGSGASAVDESAFTQGTNSVAPMGGLFKTSYTALTTGQVGIGQMTSDGALYGNLWKVGGSLFTLGQNTMANSLPVSLASNQSNVPTNTAQVNGAAVSTAASGVQKVGVVGNAGGAVDAAGQNAAAPTNELLVAAQFNTTPTTLTTSNVSPLQMDSAGNLLTNLKTALPAGANAIGSVTATQATAANLKAQTASLAGVSTSTTLQSAVVANGNGSTLSVDGMGHAVITVNCASCSGGTTVQFQASEDGSNYTAVKGLLVGTDTIASSTTTAGITVWSIPVAGYQFLRTPVASYSAGTITVTGHSDPTATALPSTNVNIVSGGGTGGGPADVGVSTAASETDANRQKVTSAIRWLDTSQTAGSQLVAAKGDQTNGVWVNCKAGCASAADTVGTQATINSGAVSATVALAGTNSTSVQLTSSTSPAFTLVSECSQDGGTTYTATVSFITSAGVTSTSLVNPGNGNYALVLPIGCTGSTTVRVRANPYTSGSIIAQLRATAKADGRVTIVDAAGNTMANLNAGRLTTLTDINNPSATATEAATYATGTAAVAETIGFTQYYNGTNWARWDSRVNVNQWNGAAVASPDGNSYPLVSPAATTTAAAAALPCNILSAASTNATNCKASAGNFYGYEIWNTTTTVYYLRLYNLASAPTCSSATGFIRSIPIPPASASGGVGGAVSNQVVSVNYSAGIGYCITGGSSSTDNTNAAVGVFGEIRYK